MDCLWAGRDLIDLDCHYCGTEVGRYKDLAGSSGELGVEMMSKSLTIPNWAKSLAAVGGILLTLFGVQLGLGVLCRATSSFSYTPEPNWSLFLAFMLALSSMG